MNNLNNLLEYITIGSSLHDENGNFIYVNPVFCKIFETSNNRVNSFKFDDNLFDIDIDNSICVINWLNSNFRKINDFTIKIKHNNINKFLKLNSIKIKNGVDYYIITYEDVTDTINYSFLYDQIFKNIKTGIIIIGINSNNNFIIKNINPYGSVIYNVNKRDIINKNINNIEFPLVNDIKLINYIKDVYKNGKPIELKFAKCVSNDNIKWENISIHKIETGEIIILFNDVTDIIEYKNKIEQSDKMKNNFLSDISHEIRSPINSIVGFLDLLDDITDKNTEESIDYINIIKSNSKYLTKLIDDILDISKIEEGNISINNTNFYVNHIIKELYDTNFKFLDNKIKFIYDIDENDTIIFADEYRFKQVVTNLINNSIKFTKEGIIKIGYTISKNYVTFYVKDTGIGIKDIDKDLIFKRFHKASHKSKIGNGLGLTISKDLIVLMNGDMWFESTYGKGSTFYFKLPTMNISKKSKNIIKKDKLSNLDLTGKKILLVEDIEFNVKLLKSYLEPTNVTILTADNGNDALIKYNEYKESIDLILMDIQIPEMDGNEVTQIIRTIDERVPIIAQTAYAIREEIDQIMQNGFNDILKKPIRKDELLEMISKYI